MTDGNDGADAFFGIVAYARAWALNRKRRQRRQPRQALAASSVKIVRRGTSWERVER